MNLTYKNGATVFIPDEEDERIDSFLEDGWEIVESAVATSDEKKLEKMKKEELLKFAEENGIEVNENLKKEEIQEVIEASLAE